MKDRGSNFISLIGTLKPSVSLQAAQSELSAIAGGIAQKYPKEAKDLKLHLIPLRNVVTAQAKPVFLALTGALILVLLIACANVANLLLARCLARSQELAVRTALGASRRALLTQMLIEGGVLCAFGAATGVALAQLMLTGIRRLPPDLIPRSQEIHLRATVFIALLVVGAIVTLLSSIVPAWVATRTDPQAVLQEGSRGTSGGPKRSRMSAAMVAGEVALSVILLISSGLMFRTLYKLQHAFLGFDESNVTQFLAMPGNAGGFFTAMTKSSSETNQANSVAFRVYEPLLQKLRNLPGVEGAAYTNSVPLQGIDMHSSIHVVGRPEEEASKESAFLRAISGGYTTVMRIPVIHGRPITEEDTASAPYVILINETLARRYFAGQQPIGQQLDLGGKDTGMIKPYTIVGVTADVVQSKLGQPPLPEIDLPYAQIPVTSMFYQFLVTPETNFLLRTRGRAEVVSAVRKLFHQSAPEFALDDIKTLQTAHEEADFTQRLGLYLIASFAAIAVVMVLAGLYGVLSQIVGQRRREIGIRMALGADRVLILGMMLRRGLVLIGIGLGVGLIASLGAEQSLKSFLYGVSPMDAATYVTVPFVLLAVGSLAALIPARRAASIEPMQALRSE
jgi:predicted permease